MPGWWNLPAGRQVGKKNIFMYYVYVIKSKIRNYIYVGLSNNYQRRFEEHNKCYNKRTKIYAPFNLIFTEKFETRVEARIREKYLKSGCGKEYIKNLIKNRD